MSESAQGYGWKYTDRDVREDQSLVEFALDYLRQTGNDFEPIVMAQRELREKESLAIRTVRIVLNCMLHDYSVANQMPVPQRPRLSLVAQPLVDPMPEKCTLTEPHTGHYLGKGYKKLCHGITNGRPYNLISPVKIKVGYIKGRGGMQMHAPHPGKTHTITRWPNQYGEGFVTRGGKIEELTVHTVCRTPGRLTNPLLLTFEQALDIVGTAPILKTPDKVITWCKTCFAEVYDD